jgi:DNA-binding NtrC family response regulator
MPMRLQADRFLSDGSGHAFDVGTASSVWLRVEPMAAGAAQLAWADRCATLTMLWHPWLAPCLDYGEWYKGYRFEAYAVPIQTGRGAGCRTHQRKRAAVGQFLEAAALPPATLVTDTGSRSCLVLPGPFSPEAAETETHPDPGSAQGHSGGMGLRLQLPRIATSVAEVLRDEPPPGVSSLAIEVPAGGGGRTLLRFIARFARLAGWLPLSTAAVAGLERLDGTCSGALHERHLAILHDGRRAGVEDQSLAHCLVRLGVSHRPRLVVRLVEPGRVVGALPWTPFSCDTLANAVLRPRARWRVRRSAAQSGGRPAVFVSGLWRQSFALCSIPAFAMADRVREARPSEVSAIDEAEVLASRGRHADAERSLRRSAAMFERRGQLTAASDALLACADRVWHRGHPDEAWTLAERARGITERYGDSERALMALSWLGRAALDRLDPDRSEAILRSCITAAAVGGHDDVRRIASVALARTLCWRGQADAAALSLDDALRPLDTERLVCARASSPIIDVPLLRVLEHGSAIRVHVARGLIEDGSAHIRALDQLPDNCSPLVRLAASSIRVRWIASLGDARALTAQLADALRLSREASRPLEAVRLRCLASEALIRMGEPQRARQFAGPLRHTSGRLLPPLLAARLALARAAADGRTDLAALSQLRRRGLTCPDTRPSKATTSPSLRSAMLEDVLEVLRVSQDGDDPARALQQVASLLRKRLSAAVVSIASPGATPAVVSAPDVPSVLLASTRRVAESGVVLQREAIDYGTESAVPVRNGGGLVGALGCRWLPGAEVDHECSRQLLAAAAAAVSPCLRAFVESLTPSSPASAVDPDLLGTSEAIERVRRAIAQAAGAPFPVLIHGESGVGKELVARALHRASVRRGRPFCAVNCAALPDDLLEAELFGHVRGAFTGAVTDRRGLFEEADGGVLFLDEIGELSPRGQAKLLRVLQESEVRRIGEAGFRRIDVRIVTATNRALDVEVEGGRFRRDLFYRLDVLRIVVPPLRERAEDVPLLARALWKRAADHVGTRATLSDRTLAALSRYDWPGNVRELQNVMAVLAVTAPRRGTVGPSGLPASIARAALESEAVTLDDARRRFEERFVRAALARAGGHRGRAATELGLSRQGLAKLIGRLKIGSQ